jgi:predicted esterase
MGTQLSRLSIEPSLSGRGQGEDAENLRDDPHPNPLLKGEGVIPFLRRLALGILVVFLLLTATARADTLVLQDGRQIDGILTQLSTMVSGAGAAPAPDTKLIIMVDDGLRRYYFPSKYKRNINPEPPAGGRPEEFNVPQPVARNGQAIGGVGSFISIDPWDRPGFPQGMGRRNLRMTGGARGQLDIMQGITKITPVYCVVEALQGSTPATPAYIWEMRIATSSIPREVLAAIINRLVDKKNPDQRLKVVKLLLQQDRFGDARAALDDVIKDFPDRQNLDSLKSVAKELQQRFAAQILEEIETRGAAGQHELARSMLDRFPVDNIDGQILQQVRAKSLEYAEMQQRGQTIVKQLEQFTAELKDAQLRDKVAPIVKEISQKLRIATLDRMATYGRFANDPNSTPEQRLALAISGWLLGSNDASENIVSTLSHVGLRDLIVEYLKTESKDKLKREEILDKIKKQEFATPKLVAALLNKMPPAFDLPEATEPGLYELSVPGVPGEMDVAYHVQLPPEYDPYVSYPCIMTLHGAGNTPAQQIEWWAGAIPGADAKSRMRMGQATRHGYIVIAPAWGKAHQKEFESSPREHHAILSVLRDACRHFSIDTDRVFLTGHSMGASAAWELGLAHPDLWAGVIPIATPAANKMTKLYWPNAEHVPFYFVGGEKDGDTMRSNAQEFERYINRNAAFDVTIAEFRGRGHEHFSDEIQRLFDWMKRRQRNFAPRKFDVVTQREIDSFFWWVELHSFEPPPSPMKIHSELTSSNGVSIRCGTKITVFLSPEMVDFSRRIPVTLNGKPMPGANKIQPDIGVMLEDSRSRGDRKHPFWAKLE